MTEYIWNEDVAARLRQAVRVSRIKQQQLVSFTGITLPTLQRILAYKSNPGRTRLAKILEALGTTPEALTGSLGSSSVYDLIPVFDFMARYEEAGSYFDAVAPETYWPFPPRFIEKFGGADTLALVRISGDSLKPDMDHGDVALVDITASQLGDGILALLLDGYPMLKRVQLRGNDVRLVSGNSQYDDIDAGRTRIAVAGKVVWVGKSL